jgi:Ca2+/H+ antiporter
MRVQIQRFSPHRNAKVFAVLFAVSSPVFVVPVMLIAGLAAPKDQGQPMFMAILFPIMYLVFGYISVAVGCWMYNVMFKHIGGIEFDHSAQ